MDKYNTLAKQEINNALDVDIPKFKKQSLQQEVQESLNDAKGYSKGPQKKIYDNVEDMKQKNPVIKYRLLKDKIDD